MRVLYRQLQTSYPYLFHLAVRTNPFDPAATAEVADAPVASGPDRPAGRTAP